MILILSKQYELSTNIVMDWLSYKKEPCYRLNGEDFVLNNFPLNLELSSDECITQIKINEKEYIKSRDIKSIWYRRDTFTHFRQNFLPEIEKENFYADVIKNLFDEYLYGANAMYNCIEQNKKKLGNFRKSSLNKIETLILAKKYGIDIPNTIVTNTKTDIENFRQRKKNIVTKSISESFDLKKTKNEQTEKYRNYTEEVTEEVVENIPNKFFYSLFQEKLDKDIEIRTFFLDGKCYSMAIFSQLNNQTSVDFRKGDGKINNRNVPYNLPKKLEKKINCLMKELDLNTGSIDIVKTKDGRFVFLEVNPIGQYIIVSYPCNYHLDKKIAEFLSNK
jgi:ATP-GRASP peptide maturase of grasp-with-spasm system